MATIEDIKPGCRLKTDEGYVSVSYVFKADADGVRKVRVLGILPGSSKGRVDVTIAEGDDITVIPYCSTEEI